MATHQDGGISKVKLALGAASLFLFLVGIKRTYRREDGSEFQDDGNPLPTEATLRTPSEEAAAPPGEPEPIRLRNAS